MFQQSKDKHLISPAVTLLFWKRVLIFQNAAEPFI